MKNLQDGEWIKPIHDGFHFQCCDCALVHEMNFKVVNGDVMFMAVRLPKETARARKRNNIEYVEEGND